VPAFPCPDVGSRREKRVPKRVPAGERLAVTVSRLAAAQPPAPTRETVTYEDRLFLRLGQERAFVRVRDIMAIEAEGDGFTLRLAPHLARKPSAKSLREWEQRLPDRHFVRIHRSTTPRHPPPLKLPPARRRFS
jgi:DNA-binding LytR/AlgR family response regulator